MNTPAAFLAPDPPLCQRAGIRAAALELAHHHLPDASLAEVLERAEEYAKFIAGEADDTT